MNAWSKGRVHELRFNPSPNRLEAGRFFSLNKENEKNQTKPKTSPADDKQFSRYSRPGILLTGTPGGWDRKDGRNKGRGGLQGT